MNCNKNFYNYNNLQDYCKKIGLVYDSEYLRWLKEIINTKVQLFKYKGLPKDINSRILEMALLFRNHLCWARVPNFGDDPILCVWVSGSTWDLYWQPMYVNLLALNGKTIATRVKFSDVVQVRDNTMDIIPFLTLNSWIEKIQEMERTLSINVQLLRLPTIFTGDKNQVASLKQMIKKITNFEPFAIGDKALVNSINSVKIDLPVKPMEMYSLLEQYKNMALASVGVYSSDSKRERLITAEIQASNDFADIVYQGMLEERRQWVKEMNEKFGTKIEIIEIYAQLSKDNAKEKAEETKAVEKAKADAQPKEDKKEEVDTNVNE